jgi:hypothetical protein
MNLRDMKPSILSLSNEQVIEVHRAIRQSRRTSKRPIKEAKKATSNFSNKVSKLDRAAAERLLKELEEMECEE